MSLQIITPDLSAVYHPVGGERGGSIAAGVGAGTRVLLPDAAVVATSAATAGRGIIALTAARYPPPAGRRLVLNLAINAQTNDTPPGGTLSFGLYPVTASGGGAGTDSITIGSIVTGSLAQLVTPAANHPYLPATSGDFDFPADGAYVIALANSAAIAAAGDTTFRASLLRRFVA